MRGRGRRSRKKKGTRTPAAGKATGRGRALPKPAARGTSANGAATAADIGRTLYQLSARHLLILKELDRLFPALAPIVDFQALAPGVESIESISRLLFEVLAERFERPVFLAFGELNAERVVDTIEQRISLGAYPLSAHEIYAEVMFRLFQRLQERDRFGRLARRPPKARDWREVAGQRTVYEMLDDGAGIVLREQIEWLRASTIPLPGLPAPSVKPPETIVADGARVLREASVRLSAQEAERWIAHALMHLPDETRRLIYLRRHRGLDASQIGELLRAKPFDVLLRLRRAELAFQEQIRGTLERFLGRAIADAREPTPETPGALLTWPRPKRENPGDRSEPEAPPPPPRAPSRPLQLLRETEDERERDD